MTNNLSLRTNARHLIKMVEDDPELLVNITLNSDKPELTKKPKTGEKIHTPKKSYHRDIDYDAVDLKIDLMTALKNNDHELMAASYYVLAYLIGIIT